MNRLNLLFQNNLNLLTLATGKKVDFGYKKYTYYSTKVIDKKIVLSIYNLDRVDRKKVYDLTKEYEEVVIDLSKATVTELSSVADFVSLFALSNAKLFSSSDIRAYKNYKLNNIQIELGKNQDKGILFTLTSIKNHNSTITFDVSLEELNVVECNFKKVITSNNYKMSLYNEYVKCLEKTEGGTIELCE